MLASRKKSLRRDLSAIESVGITFALTAEVLFRVGDKFYHSVPITDVAVMIGKFVVALLVIGFAFSLLSAAFGAIGARVLRYDGLDKAVGFTVCSGLNGAWACLVAFLPQACAFVGLSLTGLYFNEAVTFILTHVVFFAILLLLAAARGHKVGATRRECFVAFAIELMVLLIGLPIALTDNFVLAVALSLIIATAIRIVVWRVATVNDAMRAQITE